MYVDQKILKMMENMGYKTASSLDTPEQNITSENFTFQLGRKGFGMQLRNFADLSENFDFTKEDYDIQEKVHWLINSGYHHNFSLELMMTWIVEGPCDYTFNSELTFCSKDLVDKILKAKEKLTDLDSIDLSQARSRANPFETIYSMFFMNRAALKIANIDAATDFMFTNIDQCIYHRNHLGPFYFADVCAGPGGFSEYVLWRKKWLFKGFGLTLKEENDFKLSDSTCASSETFQPFYGKEGDGNVCCPDNILDFKKKVLHETHGKGVHFMMSDGGFSVQGHENLQEILSKHIYICQCLVALEIVRAHGHFVTKLFDILTPFSVGLLYLMFKCFEKVSILKPSASRPANSERYFICYNLRKDKTYKKIKKYIWTIVKRLWFLKNEKTLEIKEIVPFHIIEKNKQFYFYILNSNNSLGLKQLTGLNKLSTFYRNPTLIESRQNDLRKKCLELWQIPDEPKLYSTQWNVNNLLHSTIDKPEILLVQPREVDTIDQFSNVISEINDWHYCTLNSSKKSKVCNFYAGVGFSKVYRLQRHKWTKVKNIRLCKGTLLYGEFVKEQVQSRSQKSKVAASECYSKYSLHVIDALRLGDKSLANLRFPERLELIKIYCESINQEYETNCVRVRPKVTHELRSIEKDTLRKNINDCGYILDLPLLGYAVSSEQYIVNSLMLLKTNNSQSFYSSYVLRVQVHISGKYGEEKKQITFEEVVNKVKQTTNHS